MKRQNSELDLERVALAAGLPGRHAEGNGQVTQGRGPPRPWNFEVRTSKFEVSFPRLRERQHVRRVVVTKELSVQAAHRGVADQRDGHLAVGAAGCGSGEKRTQATRPQ